MSQQPPPLQHDQEPPPFAFSEPPPLPFMQPPALPIQPIAASPSPPLIKEGRLNPNVTFLLGIWAGIGLCAVAFCFLAISGRFEPVVRWVQRTAEDLQSPEPAQSASPIAETDNDAEVEKQEIPE